ncbi:hypothetical protein ACSBR2_012917 [Camellia fascicularis]
MDLKDQQNPLKNTDYMDIDQVFDVPDTPGRSQNINGRDCVEKESDSSVPTHSGNTDFFDEATRNRPRDRSKLVIDNGHSRRLPFRSGKNPSISNKSECDGDFTISLGNSSSSKNAHWFRRPAADKTSNHENKYFLHSQHKENGKALCTSDSHACIENAVVDLTEQSGPARVSQNAFPNGALEDHQAKEIRKGPVSTNGFPFLPGIANSSMTAHNGCKGKEKIDDPCKGASGVDRGKGIFGVSQAKAGKSMSPSFFSIPLTRVSGQKRLVRNGCISPHNIAKAKQFGENHSNGSMDVQNDKGTPVLDCSSGLIRDLIAEDDNSHRGQGVIHHPSSSKKVDAKTVDLSSRSSLAHNEEASGTSNSSGDAVRCFEGISGWRSTRNRTKKINVPLSNEGQHVSKTKDDPCFVNQQNENQVLRRYNGNGSSNRMGTDYHEDQNAVSFQHGSASTAAQGMSSLMLQSDQVSGCRAPTSTLVKRQRQGSASSNHGGSSTSASLDSEIVFFGSSGEPSNSRSTRNQNGHGPSILDPVIEIDEFSPEMRHIGSHNIGSGSNDDSDARARQVEADEMLARELQEQLYNEAPGVGDGEIDTDIALAWQQEDNVFSSGSHPVFHPSGSLFSNFYRHSQSQSSQNPSIRRGTHARGPASGRLTRLRSRLPSQLPRISHAESSLFPPNMDLDMRIHILEALEAFSDMGMAGNFLQADREFNENDYETLLALDDNNHEHGGASANQINSLPQSTVQGDFEEPCAICLETPTLGDAIRHLPCLHKFHKDCIDPWLRRKTSCPVCKSSIT